MPVVIQSVDPHSYGEKAGIKAGDTLLRVNGNSIADVLDYRFYITETKITLDLVDGKGTAYSARIKKGEYDDIGLEFETYLMDKQHTCKNKCIFCFVDQMPKGMRETLYVKDDDSRMSFLFGNYITLTNLTDEEISRIIKMRISPVNISVHTTDPALRVKMMANPRAASSLEYLKRLCDGRIKVNTQLVLCPGINDGPALEKTLEDLGRLYPNLQSIACVPVGLTRYREGLFPLRVYEKENAGQTIDVIDAFAARMEKKYGERVAYPSDEFFLKAQRPIPPAEYYGEFSQLENGVGLIALLKDEFESALRLDEESGCKGEFTIATGVGAYGLIRSLSEMVMAKHPGVKIEVWGIVNRFFGENITVAGLVTGQDIVAQLWGKRLGNKLLLPSVMLRHEQDKFLDDYTIKDIESQLGVPVKTVDNDGFMLYNAMTGRE